MSFVFTKIVGVDAYTVVGDPASVAEIPGYIGFFSNVGNLFWCAAVTVCFFSAFCLKKIKGCLQKSSFFLFFGLLSMILLLDDMFQLHELSDIFPRFVEFLIFSAYGLAFISCVYSFRKIVLSSDYLLFLVLAFAFLVASGLYEFTSETLYGKHWVEEGFKFLGIISWFAYFFFFSASSLLQSTTRGRAV
ncbi:hypothetical protein PMG71_19660 [Roseofilum sp. BLCC_M154]|uniref:Oxidase n=1 Tax=Roseofilum acuticapitatum BLCC-M154 TaxID=3022444 RepID=A0ABT7B010_9CYAN|nr:hypothetical protein [Roseofilum acuticapitatum]MDJ1171653.1 hypothetical protein [Roseofilum acuticapitatum BLCC-M154]